MLAKPTVPFCTFLVSGFFRTVVKLHSGWELFSLLLDSLRGKREKRAKSSDPLENQARWAC